MSTPGRARGWLALEIAVALAVVAVVAGILIVVNQDGGLTGPAAPPATSQSASPPASSLAGPVLAVKIDNVPAARPQTGLGSADVVYVEPVEGGLTRLVAVYAGTPPALVGPVRSARRTDIELLAQYGTPVLAYSGAAPEMLPSLHAAKLVNASPAEAASAFYRDRDRPAPHNLYLRTERLPDDATAPPVAPLRFGPAPAAGEPTTTYQVHYRAADFGFTWSASEGRWLVSLNEFWDPANENEPVLGRGNQNVFEDSVTPVHQAGLTHLWDGSYRIDRNLRLDLAPGHTPGSSVLTLESGGDRALFVGDLVHTPLQILEPDTNSCFCEDPTESRATRHRLLGHASDSNALVFPAHLGGQGAVEIERNGSKFAIKEWAGFSRIT